MATYSGFFENLAHNKRVLTWKDGAIIGAPYEKDNKYQVWVPGPPTISGPVTPGDAMVIKNKGSSGYLSWDSNKNVIGSKTEFAWNLTVGNITDNHRQFILPTLDPKDAYAITDDGTKIVLIHVGTKDLTPEQTWVIRD